MNNHARKLTNIEYVTLRHGKNSTKSSKYNRSMPQVTASNAEENGAIEAVWRLPFVIAITSRPACVPSGTLGSVA